MTRLHYSLQRPGVPGTDVSPDGHTQLRVAHGQPLRHPVPAERLLQAELGAGDTAAAEQQLQRGGVLGGRGGGPAVQRVRLRQNLQARQVTRHSVALDCRGLRHLRTRQQRGAAVRAGLLDNVPADHRPAPSQACCRPRWVHVPPG